MFTTNQFQWLSNGQLGQFASTFSARMAAPIVAPAVPRPLPQQYFPPNVPVTPASSFRGYAAPVVARPAPGTGSQFVDVRVFRLYGQNQGQTIATGTSTISQVDQAKALLPPQQPL